MDERIKNQKSVQRVARVSRLLKIVKQTSGPLSVQALETQLGVSHRKLFRDISLLRAAGFQITVVDDRPLTTTPVGDAVEKDNRPL